MPIALLTVPHCDEGGAFVYAAARRVEEGDHSCAASVRMSRLST